MSRLVIGHPVYLMGITPAEFKIKMCGQCRYPDFIRTESMMEIICDECPLNNMVTLDEAMEKGNKGNGKNA